MMREVWYLSMANAMVHDNLKLLIQLSVLAILLLHSDTAAYWLRINSFHPLVYGYLEYFFCCSTTSKMIHLLKNAVHQMTSSC